MKLKFCTEMVLNLRLHIGIGLLNHSVTGWLFHLKMHIEFLSEIFCCLECETIDRFQKQSWP